MNTEKISKNIKMMAEAKGIKISDIEKKSNVGRGYLSRTKNDLRLEVIVAASELLGVTMTSLIEEDMTKVARRIELDKQLAKVQSQKSAIEETEKAILKELGEIDGEEYI